MPLRADYATHPHTYGFQTASPGRWAFGWLPDAVTDTTARRRRGAARLLDHGAGVLPRLWTLPERVLWHLVIPLPRLPDFYASVSEVGRQEIARLLPQQPALIRAALGRGGMPHLHVLVSLAANAGPPTRGTYGRIKAEAVNTAVYLENLALYFSRPADERAARPRRQETLRYSPGELARQRLDAAEAYLQARLRHGRLPRLRWQQHIPKAGELDQMSLHLHGRRLQRPQAPWCPADGMQHLPRLQGVRPYRQRPEVIRNRGPPDRAQWGSPAVLSPALSCSLNGFSPPPHLRP